MSEFGKTCGRQRSDAVVHGVLKVRFKAWKSLSVVKHAAGSAVMLSSMVYLKSVSKLWFISQVTSFVLKTCRVTGIQRKAKKVHFPSSYAWNNCISEKQKVNKTIWCSRNVAWCCHLEKNCNLSFWHLQSWNKTQLFPKLVKNCKAVRVPAVEISTGREGLNEKNTILLGWSL